MLTPQENAIIDELVAHGWTLVPTVETVEYEDGILDALVAEGVEDDPDAMRAALEDMGVEPEDLAEWEW